MVYRVANKRLCFAALIEMILLKHGNTNYDQISIAERLGITLPSSDPLIDIIKNIKISENPYKWGINISEEELKDFFKKESISIKFSYVSATKFEDWAFKDFIFDNLNDSNIISTIDYNTLFDNSRHNLFGHAILLMNINGNKLNIFDPGPENSGMKIIDCYDLFVSSKRMNGGLWVFD